MPQINKRLLLILIPFFVFLIIEGAGYYIAFSAHKKSKDDAAPKNAAKQIKELKAKNAALRKRIDSFSPKGVNIVVDTARNVMYLKNGNRISKEVIVSCGSGNVLEDPSGKRKWIFDTPRGEYEVESKLVNPSWFKPDWAFIEEGEPIPLDSNDRVESGVLGKYALGFGNGYFIHGTLYTRLLGRNVSHGCIRVGDKDLEEIFKNTPAGARITIF